MPINKNAYLRYQVLDKCFSNFGRKFYWQDLIEEINKALYEINGVDSSIGKTQLYKDIRFMESEESFGIDLVRHQDGKKKYYRYADKSDSIRNSPLSLQESESIKSALLVLSRFSGLPQFEWINEIIPLLNDRLSLSNNEKQIIIFESNIDYTGIQFIEPIFNAIVNERVLKVNYKDFKSQVSYDLIFHPYILKQYNNRWFTFGKHQEKEIYTWNLALDRIVAIKELDEKYDLFEFNWEDDYFYDIIGVTKKPYENQEEIIFEVSSDLAPYILTKPIHPTQKKKEILDNKNIVISIKVFPNYELERLLLSFGEKIKILGPQMIKNKIIDRLKANLERY
ncbi:WYL domain-containing protein [Aureispira sp. CCB-E]|uniref:helix-turn-helix transcriptional regulator n=1 Tax=Aureispira sp. CCB-E TaxID=3051121 RepID=UPI002868477F|nr:WYL domain-containing protein [Aureispira sp. CCB-E]WMX16525.1 WYL domain-containing protein [Aureispira sp. CCB-E]